MKARVRARQTGWFSLFWGSAGLLTYTVAGFPLLVLALARARPRPVAEGDVTPSLTVVIAAHNEAAVIRAKVANVLGSDYPAERLRIVVASDGSTDATVDEASATGHPRVQVLDLPRIGKAAALNAAVAEASGEVLVFTDANSMLEPLALRRLVAPFADASVGGVAGNQVYSGSGDGAGERAHWDLDRLLKEAESTAGSVVSATGALYAVRRELFQPVVEGVTDDFYVSTGVVEAGRRLVFASGAVAREPVAPSARGEHRRKRRVMARGLRAVLARRSLLDPRRHGVYALELFTYKVLRRLLAVPLAGLLVSSVALARRGRLYRLAATAQVAFWGAAAAGVALGDRPVARNRLLALPAFTALSLHASLGAALDVLTGRKITTWTPERAEARR